MLEIEKFEGLIAAPFTPFDEKGRLNIPIIQEYYSFLKRNGIAGIFINGSTGEGVSLSNKEKQLNAGAWAGAMKQDGKIRVINLVGGTCLGECIDNAVFSKECGLSAIAIIAPFYFRPDEGRLAEFIAKVGESVPDLPVYFYHIPELTGVNMPMIGLLKRISGMLPNFAGIKYTKEDLMDFLSCINFEGGKYDMLWGKDECLLAALATGAKGAVGSTYNYAAPLYHALFRSFMQGDLDEARDLQQKSIQIVELLAKYGGISTGKAFMRYVGIDCGKFRLPVNNMTEEMYLGFEKDVKALKMENYFSRK